MAESAGILEAQADFSLQLLRQINANSTSSVVLSPISVALALSLAYAGAEEDTRDEFDKVFAAGQKKEELHKSFQKLMGFFANSNKAYTLDTVNQIYLDSGYSIKDTYRKIVTDFYGGNFESMDFGNPSAVVDRVNSFVSEKTHKKIQDLISSDAISGDVKMILINAIYYKGSWKEKFDKGHTNDKEFFVGEGAPSKQVRMMYKKFKVIYHEDQNYQMVGIPYAGEEIYFFAFLPTDRFGLDKLVAELDGKKLMECLKKRHTTEVKVELPAFKIESSEMLREHLVKMGFSRGFTNGANFRGINETEPLKIDQVIHKAFIETNEEGSEAAAATGVTMRLLSFDPSDQPPHFLADHPFLYVLATKDSQILFAGTVRAP